jgi:beta-lactamase class D
MRQAYLIASALVATSIPRLAQAETICTIVMDAADGHVLLERGNCRTRVTPASTFKVPLAVMGFDSGFLTDAHTPVLNYKAGDPDWGGANWRQPTDPTRWLKYSVVWYSQRVTHALGEARLTDYAHKFGFGNADFSGDPGKGNGLDRAWIASSLQVSPYEQVTFLRQLATHRLPVSARAMAEAEQVVEISPAGDGWQMHGKTGTAYRRDASGATDEAHGYGWYVGWATKGGRTLTVARLDQDEHSATVPTGLRTRAALLEAWSATADAAIGPQPQK